MLVRLLLRLVVLGVIIDLVAWIVPDIHVSGGFLTYLWLAALFSVINLIVGPILRLLSLPLILLTFGLFLILINAALLGLTALLSSKLSIDSFWAAVFGGILISVFSWIADLALPIRKPKNAKR